MIPQSFIQDLLVRVDIVDVVGRYVQLKKGGANLLGLCPFHNEKSPSFTVSPAKQFFHCFGCGAHGSAVGFLMEHAGISYVEAIHDLARTVGMVVPQQESQAFLGKSLSVPQEESVSPSLLNVMARVSQCYRQQLRQSPQAIAYLKGRGLSGEVAAKFGLGYAPKGWQSLLNEFGSYQDKTVTQPLLAVGVLIKSERAGQAGEDRYYDRFRDRIVFPIRNTKGQIIAFGGRVLDGGGEPKYLNSPETPLFSKGHELYGLFEARSAIREMGYVLVTEGYMDVVALAQHGFNNVVATLGTACTPFHIQKLLRQTDRIVFSFDGDKAGKHAARRALDACLPYLSDGKAIYFLFLPGEHDPDSFVRTRGAEMFAKEVENAMPLSQFLLRLVSQGVDLRQPEGRAQALAMAKPLLQNIPAGGFRLQIVHSLAELTVSSAEEIEAICDLKATVARRSYPPLAKSKRLPPTALGQQILRLLLCFPELASNLDAKTRTMLTQVDHAEGAILADLLRYCDRCGSSFAMLNEYLMQSSFASNYVVLQQEVMMSNITIDVAKIELTGAVKKLIKELFKREQNILVERLQSGQASEAEYTHYRTLMDRIHKDQSI